MFKYTITYSLLLVLCCTADLWNLLISYNYNFAPIEQRVKPNIFIWNILFSRSPDNLSIHQLFLLEIIICVNILKKKKIKAAEIKSQRQGIQCRLGLMVSSRVPQNEFKTPRVKGQ